MRAVRNGGLLTRGHCSPHPLPPGQRGGWCAGDRIAWTRSEPGWRLKVKITQRSILSNGSHLRQPFNDFSLKAKFIQVTERLLSLLPFKVSRTLVELKEEVRVGH